MTQYILRRFLLMIPTFLGITILVFTILQLVPGGPLEQELLKAQAAMMAGGESGAGSSTSETGMVELPKESVQRLKEFYGLDKPGPVRYLIWLGIWPKEINQYHLKFEDGITEKKQRLSRRSSLTVNLINDVPSVVQLDGEKRKWKAKIINTDDKNGEKDVKIYQTAFRGIFTGYLGKSYTYAESVWTLIKERLHISAYFGLISFFLSYMVCIPLGITKALKHGSKFDAASSVIVFIGYSTPGFILGALLLVYFGGGSFWDVFPLGEFRSEDFEYFTFWEKVKDQLHHTILPVISYMVAAFATLTVLMKNSLLENLSQDYVRTAFAKGLSEKRVVFYHTVRNSLIPLATGIGGLLGVWLAGSYLIERVFNINGIGMLSYMAIIQRDYPVVMGFLVIGTIIRLIGNLISDMAYAAIDPRIRFK
ncbi:MAG: ABC transporter permease subunit [Candidatus Marinimicrobia bacterium]|nr:ABC transporter permease subunit [Candidatus Neomarinimicrobiota bacterium]